MELTMVFATKNPAKLREVMDIMAGSPFRVISMTEAGVDPDINENGETFEANAIIKAQAVMAATGLPTLADDSGLVIDYLNGAPGVYSARFMGEDTDYGVKNARIIEMLAAVPDSDRTARFVCAIAAAFPESFDAATPIMVETAAFEGFIAKEALGVNGFGYDPIFYLPEFGMSAAQLDPTQKNRISHRGKALRQMRDRLLREIN